MLPSIPPKLREKLFSSENEINARRKTQKAVFDSDIATTDTEASRAVCSPERYIFDVGKNAPQSRVVTPPPHDFHPQSHSQLTSSPQSEIPLLPEITTPVNHVSRVPQFRPKLDGVVSEAKRFFQLNGIEYGSIEGKFNR